MNDNMTALVPSAAMPVMDVSVALSRYRSMNSFIGQVLRENTDYGIVPGTGNKRTLLKPGAEKLSTFFGLAPTFEHVRVIEDWTGKDHDGEPFFYYLVKCRLTKHGQVIAEGDGSCNSRETKYRYRTSERVCPACGQATIIKGRDDYGGGWLCYAKKGGCGAKYKDGDKTIEEQKTGRIPNPDIADQVNTILKMAEKRALIAAVLIGVNASDYFTQDVEDLPGYGDIVAEYRVVEPTPVTATPATAEAPAKPNGHNGTPHHDAEGEFANLTSAQAERQPAPATNGESDKPAVVRTTWFVERAPAFVQEVPYYANAEGKPDLMHMRMSAAKAGYPEITGPNLPAVFEALRQRAQQKQQPA